MAPYPYKDCGNARASERNYNYRHSATKMAIERAFALLEGRWRKLKYVDISRVEDIPDIIIAACAHNICLMTEDDYPDFIESDGDEEVNSFENIERARESAVGKRDRIRD